MNLEGHTITSSKNDDDLLSEVSECVSRDIKNKYLCSIPDNWSIVCSNRSIKFIDISNLAVENGIPSTIVKKYYNEHNSIQTDSYIIYLTINCGDKIIKKPLFMGEMKKQGTNDSRLLSGKKKQAIGNAGPDRVAKNFIIASDYCYLCDKDFFPYNVFLHGCDFDENEITSTIKSKLQPFFGELNKLNPFFDKDMLSILNEHKGGSCFYQKQNYTFKQLYDICFKCCEMGINHYLTKKVD